MNGRCEQGRTGSLTDRTYIWCGNDKIHDEHWAAETEAAVRSHLHRPHHPHCPHVMADRTVVRTLTVPEHWNDLIHKNIVVLTCRYQLSAAAGKVWMLDAAVQQGASSCRQTQHRKYTPFQNKSLAYGLGLLLWHAIWLLGLRRALYCKHHASTLAVIVVFILKNQTETRVELSTWSDMVNPGLLKSWHGDLTGTCHQPCKHLF